jgi:hypothetical protein
MDETVATRRVDQSAVRTNLACTIMLLMLAFVLDAPWLAAVVAVCNLTGALAPEVSPFRQLYLRILKPRGWVRPDVLPDNPEPHRFALGVGATFVTLGVAALLAGSPLVGWALVWLVIGLAAVNLFLHFCVGCFMYYQLNRLGVPGFRYSPVQRS